MMQISGYFDTENYVSRLGIIKICLNIDDFSYIIFWAKTKFMHQIYILIDINVVIFQKNDKTTCLRQWCFDFGTDCHKSLDRSQEIDIIQCFCNFPLTFSFAISEPDPVRNVNVAAEARKLTVRWMRPFNVFGVFRYYMVIYYFSNAAGTAYIPTCS